MTILRMLVVVYVVPFVLVQLVLIPVWLVVHQRRLHTDLSEGT